MKKIAIIGCGAYMNSGYGCPGEWRCLKAAALGEGNISEPAQVVAFLTCECPGRTAAPNLGMAIKMSEIKPDEVYFSTCMASAKPACPYADVEEIAAVVENKTGLKPILGTHEYK